MHPQANSISPVYRECFFQAERLIGKEASDVMRDHNARVFDEPSLLAERLLSHSVNEAVGAAVLSSVARYHSGSDDGRMLLQHARDEARHSKMLGRASSSIVPRLASRDRDTRARAKTEIEHYDGRLMSFYCATHVAEVRNLFVLAQYLELVEQRPAVAAYGLSKLFGEILRDEQGHVAYTGAIITPWLERSEEAIATFIQYAEIHKNLVLNPGLEA